MSIRITPAQILANLFLDAVIMREASYDWAASLADIERTQKDKQIARRRNPGDPTADSYIYYGKTHYYTLDEFTCATRVSEANGQQELALPVYLLMVGGYNDTVDWATEISGRKLEQSAESKAWQASMEAIYEKYKD